MMRTAFFLLGLFVADRAMATDPALKIEKVRDGLYVIYGQVGSVAGNVAVRVTSEGVILVDDKYEEDRVEVLRLVRTVTKLPVRYVLSTHHHPDHTSGNVGFISMTEIIAHENARKNMVAEDQPAPPRLTYSNRFSVHLGGVEVEAVYIGRGHTNGDVVVRFPDLNVIHSGDLFIDSMPAIDYAAGGSSTEWMTTLDRMMALPFDTVIPGHGSFVAKAEIPKWKSKFEILRQRMRVLARKGIDKKDIEAQLKLDDLGWTVRESTRVSLPGLYDEMLIAP